MDIHDLLKEAIRIVGGSQAKLSRACGRTQNAISMALKRGHVSRDLARRIDHATNGAVSFGQLRPDLSWPHKPERLDQPTKRP